MCSVLYWSVIQGRDDQQAKGKKQVQDCMVSCHKPETPEIERSAIGP
jgi:hypothetical protein